MVFKGGLKLNFTLIHHKTINAIVTQNNTKPAALLTYFPSPVIIKKLERLLDLLNRIPIQYLLRHFISKLVLIFSNSSKKINPFCSFSQSRRILSTSTFLTSKPRARIATCLEEMYPELHLMYLY